MKTVKVLPYEEIKFVKFIAFEVEVDGVLCTAQIVYRRNPSENYTLDDSKRSNLDRLLYYYPEECYPQDDVDVIILNAIKEVYPEASLSTRFMLCNVEKEEIERILSTYTKTNFKIVILPRIRDWVDVISSGKTSWLGFEKELSLFVHLKKQNNEYIHNISTVYYDVENEDKMIEMEPTLLNEVQKW